MTSQLAACVRLPYAILNLRSFKRMLLSLHIPHCMAFPSPLFFPTFSLFPRSFGLCCKHPLSQQAEAVW